MGASRLAFHCAYKWDEVLPEVEDPKDILAFLTHHFELAEKAKTTTSQFETLCAHWLLPPLPRASRSSRTSTQPNHLSFKVSASRFRTSVLANFARQPSSSFPSSPKSGSTLPTQ